MLFNKKIINNLFKLKWIFYPSSCEVCDCNLDYKNEIPFLCKKCADNLSYLKKDACLTCLGNFNVSINRKSCFNCESRDLNFNFIISYVQTNALSKDLIYRYKYLNKIYLSKTFAHFFNSMRDDERLKKIDYWKIIPVPLHVSKQNRRGFNQSKEIALDFIKNNKSKNIKLFPIIKKIKKTRQQASLEREDRLKNLRGAFKISKKKKLLNNLFPQIVGFIIIDDVITTGSTIEECAKELRSVYKENIIIGMSFMRGQ